MKRFSLFLTAFIIWLLLTNSLDWQHLLIGILVSFISALIFGSQFISTFYLLNPIRIFYMIIYLILFIWECIKANFDVAYRVIHPKMPIKPGIVKVRTNLKSDLAKTMLANSITMTPGTLSIDIKDEFLWIHWIKVRSQKMEEATRLIVGRFEKLLIRIFK
jgi:multicomponent Na+:H+ antiporter subunit E